MEPRRSNEGIQLVGLRGAGLALHTNYHERTRRELELPWPRPCLRSAGGLTSPSSRSPRPVASDPQGRAGLVARISRSG